MCTDENYEEKFLTFWSAKLEFEEVPLEFEVV